MKSLALLLLCAWLTARPAQAEPYRITTDDYRPYVIVEAGKVSGVIPDLINAALKDSGATVQYEVLPWARAMGMAESGLVAGTMPWFRTVEREAKFLISAPLIETKNVIFVRKGGKLRTDMPWKTYADFAPYRMGGVLGFWYVEGFKRAGVPLDLVVRDELNVLKLELNRIDAFIADERGGWGLISKHFPGREGEFATLDKPESVAPLYVMSGKGTPGAEHFMERLNTGMARLRASGQYEKIVQINK